MLHFLAKYRRLLFLILMALGCATLLASGIQNKHNKSAFDRTVLALFGLPLRASTAAVDRVVGLWKNYIFLVELRQKNIGLNQRVDQLTITNQLLRQYAQENQRLRQMLDLQPTRPFRGIAAEIIGRDPISWFKSVQIDKATRHGIVVGAGVITADGVVGRVATVTGATATVLLITDVNSAVDSEIVRSGTGSILAGCGEGRCQLNYLQKGEDVAVGDTVSTSGLNSIYPRGLLLGTITAVDTTPRGFFLAVEMLPAVDFSKLGTVMVLTREAP